MQLVTHLKGSDRLILFFNGWGMDESIVSHLSNDSDLIIYYDYRSVEPLPNNLYDGYKEIYLIAWSMGVWAATVAVDFNKISYAIAINGTPCPVHSDYGIAPRIYTLTERGLNDESKEKFFKRMNCNNMVASRPTEQIKEELRAIREASIKSDQKSDSIWSVAVVATNDVIIPSANQLKYWQGANVRVVDLFSGHYPFNDFTSWDEVLDLVFI